jgi:SMODS-associated and fused to various effectors sensor domain
MVENKFDSIIVIAHIGIEGKGITMDECYAALPSDSPAKRFFIDFQTTKHKLSELYDASFEQIALEQQRKFKSDVEPLLKSNPNSIIAYFGFASVPASFHLGFLFNGFNDFLIYQYHHENKSWYRELSNIDDKSFKVLPIDFPNKIEKGKGDIFIRVSTSYRIEPQHTYEVVTNPTNEFDITLENLSPDAFSNQSQIHEIVKVFQEVLSACSNNLPDRDKIHLFLSTSAGIPFALGTKINPTIFPFVQTYQFAKDRTPKYKNAILVTSESDDAPLLTESDIKKAKKLRKEWAKQLDDNIKAFIKNLSRKTWYEQVTLTNDVEQISGSWTNLPKLEETSLVKDKINLEELNIENGFKYSNSLSEWYIDNGMLVSIEKRFSKNPHVDKLRAGRLFLFHEGLHYSPVGHNLLAEIATGIGQFPKVIEDADYQADVWAILHEYRYSSVYYLNQTKNLKKFFLDTIDTAVETMWSFVDNEVLLKDIQIRSMNRFLNWYWQWIRIEQLNGNYELKDIIKILFDQPTIEFAGAEVVSYNQRTYFRLSNKNLENLEIAIFFRNRVYRFSPTRIESIFLGFRELNGDKIKQGLRSFWATL